MKKWILFGMMLATSLAIGATSPPWVQTVAVMSSGSVTSLTIPFTVKTAGATVIVDFSFAAASSLPATPVTDVEQNYYFSPGGTLTSPAGEHGNSYVARNLKVGSNSITIKVNVASPIESYVTEYSGSNTVTPIDVQAGKPGTAGPVTSGTAITKYANETIHGWCLGDGACSLVAGSGFTARSTVHSNLVEDQYVGPAGSYAATATANSGWTMQMLAIAPAAVVTPPQAVFSPPSITFPAQALGTVSPPQVVTMTNAGGSPLSIASMTLAGINANEFTQTNNCGTSLAAGASCTINFSFAPTATRFGVLAITSNGTGSPQSVNLSGTASGTVGAHTVVLLWTPSPTVGVLGYNIYRGTVSGGEGSTPINSKPINASTWTDTNVTAGDTYFYVATAISSDGITQSVKSNEASATIPTP